MTQINYAKRQEIIEKLISYANTASGVGKRLSGKKLELVATFIRQFYDNAPLDDLEHRSIVNLYGAVISHWQLIYEQAPNSNQIHVFNPSFEEDGWESTHTIVQVNVDPDMPFLVNSMRMELDRLGFTVHLIIHPGGIRVRRDSKNRIVAFLPNDAKSQDVIVEAPIYMEIDRQTDPDKLTLVQDNLERVFNDIRLAFDDWPKMQQQVFDALADIEKSKIPLNPEEIEESKAFLRWLVDHFTFVGFRRYELVGKDKTLALKLIKNSSLGVLRDDAKSKHTRYLSELPPGALKLILSKQIITISQSNTMSTIHRPNAYTYIICVKTFSETGKMNGERRFVGLFTSEAYNNNPRDLPYLSRKVGMIVKKSGLTPNSHAAKALLNILETLPRDDLYQGSVEELCYLGMGILHLQERRRISLFVREDAYGRYISCLVYVPRDNFNTDLLYRMLEILRDDFHGEDVTFNTYFPDSILARIHFVVRTDPSSPHDYNVEEIERKLIEIGRSWKDSLRESLLEYFGEEKGNYLIGRYERAFPAGFREIFVARSAVYDIEHIEKLSEENQLEMSFYRPVGAPESTIRFKLYHLNTTIPLSDALPMLENMGLRVIGEQPYQIRPKDAPTIWINDFNMVYGKKDPINVEEIKLLFHNAFNKIWFGKAEDDGFNHLVLGAQLSWREISILRAYAKYFRQIGFIFSQNYIEETLTGNPNVARLLISLFKSRFDPNQADQLPSQIENLEKELEEALDDVVHLDQDRILRQFRDVMYATLRTNYFQPDKQKSFGIYLSFKLEPKKLPNVPLPLPKYEIFVYSPDFEGVHLRAGKVARGGIRWSDRREDFRTEILGLMKAQQVKNALIVPSGAKGGFVPKNLPETGTREEFFAEAIRCYQNFIRGLLDLTDNRQGDEIIHPEDTLRYDLDDPYFVVAADKGTATFSDIANDIAKQYKYWLGDAFASGGSAGYDHKKMGITARGAWVSVERHFQELKLDPKKQDFTVVGIGDMSGDVFGNGMLLSKHIKLIAAFNHQHIFIDPNPDALKSFKERQRLFKLPRSSWEDYDSTVLSKGAAIYSRSVKSIRLSKEAQEALGVESEKIVPSDLIKIILKAPVDLIWNGGIGTYVKATTETQESAGDKTNDSVRINATQIRAKVVAEGGNLGLTQLARIECELNGGRINTDFVDNSAGVDCSDHEVNIKILLDGIVAEGDMTVKQRNTTLINMTDEVAELVLRNNYRQTRSIGLVAKQSSEYLNLYQRFVDTQAELGNLDPEIEFLPDEKTFNERKAKGVGLTRPEIAVLQAYSKIILKDAIWKSELPENTHFAKYIEIEFPEPLRDKYSEKMKKHRLAREIISTQFSNDVVNDMGFAFIHQMHDETSASTPAIVSAYTAARAIFRTQRLWKSIDDLDHKIDIEVQRDMLIEIVRLIRRTTRWLLRNRSKKFDITGTISLFSGHVNNLREHLLEHITGADAEYIKEREKELVTAKVPKEIASQIAGLRAIFSALNIVEAASTHSESISDVMTVYFQLAEKLELTWFREQINNFDVSNHWTVLARAAFKGDLDWLQRALTVAVLHQKPRSRNVKLLLESWLDKQQRFITRWQRLIDDLRSSSANDYAMLTVAVRELTDLAEVGQQCHYGEK